MISIPFRSLRGQHAGVPEQLLFDLDQNFKMVDRVYPQERQLCDTRTASLVFQLPDGRTSLVDFLFVKVDSSVNTVTIYPATGQTINGATSRALTTQYAKAYLVFNRSTSDWIVL